MFSNTDSDWEYYGKNDPYFGVITHEEYRSKNLDESRMQAFFEAGTKHVDEVVGIVKDHICKDFAPEKVLDFGCGVGRLVVPFARKYEYVVGVDVSPSMLSEAKRNCDRFNLTNVNFVISDDSLQNISEKFDFIHSYIVFQHIPSNRGNMLFLRLLDALKPGGVGALHFTYKCSPFKRLFDLLPFTNTLYSLYKQKPIADRPIQMNQYNLNFIFYQLQEIGCKNLYISYTRHGQNNDGVTIFFQK